MTARRLDSGLAGALLVAVPVALVLGVGVPSVGVAPTSAHLLGTATMLAWSAWAWCAGGVVLDVVRRVRTKDTSTVAGTGVLTRLAAQLAAVLLAASSMASSLPAGATAGRNVPARPPVAAQLGDGAGRTPITHATGDDAERAVPSLVPVDASTLRWTVASGDCLWSIAERLEGDGEGWTLLAAVNLGHVMDDGRIFTDPSLIYPGWVLDIPPSMVHASTAPPVPPTVAPSPPTDDVDPRSEVPPRRTHPAASSDAPSAVAPGTSSAIMIASVLGVGAVGAGLLLRRRRRFDRSRWIDDDLLDVDVLLEQSAPSPGLTLTEAALQLAAADGVLAGTCLVSVGMDGARAFLGGDQVWHAEPADLVAHDAAAAVPPGALVPLGDLDGTSWTMVVPAGSIGHIGGGAAAEQLVDLAVGLQTELAWGPRIEAALPGTDIPERLPYLDGLLVGSDPSQRHPRLAVICATTEATAVTVDDHGIDLIELGLRIPRSGPSPLLPSLLDEPIPPTEPAHDPPPSAAPLDVRSITEAGGPMVRMLVAEPRIDGLVAPIDPKRSRRAIEVVAYLALHDPDPVAGDRLRTRVLGSSARDAAAKTLFNVTSAARRGLGLTPEGDPVLPIADRSGCYRAGSWITSDIAELHAHLACARRAQDPSAQMAHLRAALELVEGEPLAATLAGWDWFTAEGHRSRIEVAIEDAAVWLVHLALDEGLCDLAQLALDRARPALPHSEHLAAAAMEVAGQRGTMADLRRCFDELGAIVDELDPGSWPTVEHEERFGALVEQLRGRRDQASLAAMVAAPRSTRPSAPAAL